MLNSSEGGRNLPPEILESIAYQDCILSYISIPCATLSLVAILLIFATLIKSSFNQDSLVTLWKPRTIFEGKLIHPFIHTLSRYNFDILTLGLSLINTLLGIVFGIYGFVYVYHRHVRPFEPSTLQWLTYAFVFHRFLLIGGDLFPSLDRCVAILFPLKYYMVSSPCCAFGMLLLIVLFFSDTR